MQNINLCVGLPKKQKAFLNFKIFKIIMMVWILLLIAIYAILFLFHLSNPYTLFQLERKKTALNKTIEEQAKKNQLGEEEVLLQKEIETLKNNVSDEQKKLVVFKQQGEVKFSNYLKLFSLQTPDDVWLKSMEIKPKMNYLKLTGFTISPPLAITFLHALEADNLFKGYRLKITEMKKQDKEGFIFVINSEKKGGDNEK